MIYRLIFSLAALYNIAFGIWACIWPGALFAMLEMAAPNYPSLWQCLGMVVGLYGILYAYAAIRLERAKLIIVIGRAGKILGPIGMFIAFQSGEWPLRAVTLIVFNDFVWWLPFTVFLLDGTRMGERLRASAPYSCATLNLLPQWQCCSFCVAGVRLHRISQSERPSLPSMHCYGAPAGRSG
jgi:small multidrug resistance pump